MKVHFLFIQLNRNGFWQISSQNHSTIKTFLNVLQFTHPPKSCLNCLFFLSVCVCACVNTFKEERFQELLNKTLNGTEKKVVTFCFNCSILSKEIANIKRMSEKLKASFFIKMKLSIIYSGGKRACLLTC